jgi:hypothetical protein
MASNQNRRLTLIWIMMIALALAWLYFTGPIGN